MAEKIRCASCIGETRAECDLYYARFVTMQEWASEESTAEVDRLAPMYPDAPAGEILLDGQKAFTDRARGYFPDFLAKEIGCLLTEDEIDSNITQAIIERN